MDIRTLLLVLIGIGTLLIGIGIYLLIRPTQHPVQIINTASTPIVQSTLATSTTTISSSNETKSVIVRADEVWNNTGVEVKKGDTITIQASGRINIATPGEGGDKWVDPDGWGYIPQFNCGNQPCRYTYEVTESLAALIGKIGNAKPFHVGSSKTFTASESGVLHLGVNDGISDWKGIKLNENELQRAIYFNNSGSFTANIEVK